MVQPNNSTDTATAEKISRFISSGRLDFHIVDNLSIAVHAFPMRMLTSLSVDEISLARHVNWSINFRELSFIMEMAPFCSKHMNFVLSEFM